MAKAKPLSEHKDGGYLRRHKNVARARGRAAEHVCSEGCGKQARQWAHVHDSNPDDVQNYKPMCIGCHRTYDDIERRSSEAQKGKARPDVAARMAGNTNASGKRTPEQRARIREARWGRPGMK